MMPVLLPGDVSIAAVAIAGMMKITTVRSKQRVTVNFMVILFNFSGHGLMDMVGYDKFLTGKLSKHKMSDKELFQYLEELKDYPKPLV